MMNNEMHWSEGNHKLHGPYIKLYIKEYEHQGQWSPSTVLFHNGKMSDDLMANKKIQMAEEFERYLEERVTALSPETKTHRFGE